MRRGTEGIADFQMELNELGENSYRCHRKNSYSIYGSKLIPFFRGSPSYLLMCEKSTFEEGETRQGQLLVSNVAVFGNMGNTGYTMHSALCLWPLQRRTLCTVCRLNCLVGWLKLNQSPYLSFKRKVLLSTRGKKSSTYRSLKPHSAVTEGYRVLAASIDRLYI